MRGAARPDRHGGDGAALAALWGTEMEPFFVATCRMLEAAGGTAAPRLVKIRDELRKLVGEVDANALLTGVAADGELASLGPLVGLEQAVARRDRPGTLRAHVRASGPARVRGLRCRGPPRTRSGSSEQLAGSARPAHRDGEALLARQAKAREEAWERFAERYPRKGSRCGTGSRAGAEGVRDREAARSECIRAFWVLRAFVLRAGRLTGHGDDLFFLTIEEILASPGRRRAALAQVPGAPRDLRALPRAAALPDADPRAVRRGRGGRPTPQRRSDVFDARGGRAPVSDAITGFPGAAGVVEGVARVIATPEEGEQLQPGEILVTTVTNVGWTPLFPRAAAVVTDVGAPLSHAAIVARELGIPAVVGCGNATMRLHDGDRVRVDGERGTVEVLRSAVRQHRDSVG